MVQRPLYEAIPNFKRNEERADKFINGGENEDWVTDAGELVPTMRKLTKRIGDDANALQVTIRQEADHNRQAIRDEADQLKAVIRSEGDQLIADVTGEVDHILPDARLAAATAQSFGARTMNTVEDLLNDESLTEENTQIGDTVHVRTMGLLSTTADPTGFFENAMGLKFEPVTGNIVYLSQYGVNDGDDATTALKRMFSKSRRNQRLIIDRNVSYTDSNTFLTLDVDQASELEFVGNGSIEVAEMNPANRPYFIRMHGKLKKTIVLSAPVSSGSVMIPVVNASNVKKGDLITIQNNNIFNGKVAVAGFSPCYEEDHAVVRAVIGNSIIVEAPLDFSYTTSGVTYARVYETKSNPRVINPRIKGPSPQTLLENGQGESGIGIEFATNAFVTGGRVTGFQNAQVEFAACYLTHAEAIDMHSDWEEKTTQSFYGVMCRGGRFNSVVNCTGQNIRRVADTQTSPLSVDIFHRDLIGVGCNGSAAGTHHGLRYKARDIAAFDCQGVMSIRAKEVDVYGVKQEGCHAGIIVGAALPHGEAFDYGLIKIHGISFGLPRAGGGSGAVTPNAEGRYDIQFDRLEGWVAVNGTASESANKSAAVYGFKVRGKLDGKGRATSNAIALGEQEILQDVDISVTTKGYTASPVLISGTTKPNTPATRINIHDIVDEDRTSVIVTLNPTGRVGYFGDDVIVENVKALASTNPINIPTASRPFFKNYPVIRNISGQQNSDASRMGKVVLQIDAIPNGLTFLKGDVVEAETITAGGYRKRIATLGGTTGNLTTLNGSTVTANSNIGSDTILLTTASIYVSIGTYVKVAGATFLVNGVSQSYARVVNKSADGLHVTLSGAAEQVVSGGEVSFQNPTWKSFEQIEA